MHRSSNKNQWLLSHLVGGLGLVTTGSPSDRVRRHRQHRMAQLVLRALFDDPTAPTYPKTGRHSRRV
jgi:hypothetical protein